MNMYLTELQKIAANYQWHYVTLNRQAQIELIAYRIWQQAGCPEGRHEDQWLQAEREFFADKPIRGMILKAPQVTLVGQSLTPLQALVHSRKGEVWPFAEILKRSGDGLAITESEARAIEEATEAASKNCDRDLRKRIEQALGLVR